ncbi:MAG: hypothetical protein PVG74_20995 [Desulfobacterales bacterium]
MRKTNMINNQVFKTIVLLAYVSALMFTGCSGNTSKLAGGDEIVVVPVIGADYRLQGNKSYDTFEGTIRSSTGCNVTYTLYRPTDAIKEVLVILGHGFLRSRKRMAYFARHLTSWGLPVVNVEFCNSKLWAGNHDQNGADMVAVARRLGPQRTLYTGFSAGGLAALVAADLDKNAIAFFGLDMVDNQGLGKKTAPKLKIASYGLIAAPSACNAENNALKIYEQALDSFAVEVEDSSHCHFEIPVDRKCSLVCGRGETQFSTQVIQQTILGLSTAFMLWQTGIDTNGKTWWADDYQNYKLLRDAGYIKEP